MRKLIIAASLLALAAPAAAQPPRHPAPADDHLARRLPPPAEIESIGVALGRVADALMGVDVGPVGDALDPYRRPGRRETLGDIASRRDPYARDRIHQSIGSTSAGMAAAANEIAIMAPTLRRSFEDAARRIEAAAIVGAYPADRRRGYGPAYDRDRDANQDYDRDNDRDYDRDADRDNDRDYDRDNDIDDDRDRGADEPR